MEQHRAETLRTLRQLCRGVAKPFALRSGEQSLLSTGLLALDELLPERGLKPGWIVEWLAPIEGCGAAVVALQGVRQALPQQSVWAVVDATCEFYPLAASGWGVSLDTLLWLRPSSFVDAAWTVEQCLRCPAVSVTWFWADPLPDRVLQRWKIAAETGGGIGVLFRPAKAARYASWADVRWLVQPIMATSATSALTLDHQNGSLSAWAEREKKSKSDVAVGQIPTASGRRVRVELLSCRGECRVGGAVELEVCDASGNVRVVSGMADTASAVRAVRA